MMKRLTYLLCLLLWSILPAGPAAAQPFRPDDPLQVDPDRLDMPAPSARELSDFYDFIENTFGGPADYEGPALNVNTLGEVPNSSWYTNRHYRERRSLEALRRGPNEYEGPSTEAPWEVVGGKNEGKSVGLQIEDARGDRYLLKFDPMGYPEMTTGAEVVSTRFMHALGYHVPENYIITFCPDQLTPGPDATIETPGGEEVPLTDAYVRTLLEQVPVRADGCYRAVASRLLSGKPLGPFRYYGTRPDDANDLFPHESRRELRGLRVFAAWLNHTDARSINSLDMLVEEDGRQYVRHHLIDFGSTLGAGALGPKRRWDGYEYAIEGVPIATRALTLGFGGSPWVEIDYPDYPAVGRFEAAHFDPRAWKPQYPNAAFRRMDAADAFWAARQVMHFTDEEIRAVVETGEYTNPEAEAYLVETLIERRDRIGAAYLGLGGGLDRFRVEEGRLVFDDLQARYGFAAADRARHVIWRPYDNAADTVGAPLQAGTRTGTVLPIPEADHAFLTVELRTPGQGLTRVYLRRTTTGGYEVVGLRREAARED